MVRLIILASLLLPIAASADCLHWLTCNYDIVCDDGRCNSIEDNLPSGSAWVGMSVRNGTGDGNILLACMLETIRASQISDSGCSEISRNAVPSLMSAMPFVPYYDSGANTIRYFDGNDGRERQVDTATVYGLLKRFRIASDPVFRSGVPGRENESTHPRPTD